MTKHMCSNTPIVCFSSNDWTDIPSSKFHIMRHFGETRTVLYIDTIGIRQPKLSTRDAKRAFNKLKMSLRGVRNVETQIYTWSPCAIPFHGYRGVGSINSLCIGKIVRHIMAKLDIKKPIIWSYIPNAIDIIKRIDGSSVVYHCIDDYGEFTDTPKQAYEAMEKEMLERVNLTVVSSKQLLSLKQPYSKNIVYIPHGVD